MPDHRLTTAIPLNQLPAFRDLMQSIKAKAQESGQPLSEEEIDALLGAKAKELSQDELDLEEAK